VPFVPEDKSPTAFDPDAVADAMAPLLGLVIDPAYRPGVLANLKVMAAMADLVLSVPMDEREEPAPVFRP
jgi:hypothetical protein